MSVWLKHREYDLCLFSGRQKRNWMLLRNFKRNLRYLQTRAVVKFRLVASVFHLTIKQFSYWKAPGSFLFSLCPIGLETLNVINDIISCL